MSVGGTLVARRAADAKRRRAARTAAPAAREGTIEFREGIFGFPEFKRYCLEDVAPGRPFKWLRAVDDGGPQFIILDPRYFRPDYAPPLSAEDLRALQLEDASRAKVYVLVTIPEDPVAMTANLRGPLVFNPEAGLAKQVVLLSGEFSTRHRILDEMRRHVG